MLIKCDKTQDSEPPENNFMIPPPRYLTLCTSSDLLLTHLSLFVTMNVSDNLMLISTSWKMFCWLNSFYGTQLEKNGQPNELMMMMQNLGNSFLPLFQPFRAVFKWVSMIEDTFATGKYWLCFITVLGYANHLFVKFNFIVQHKSRQRNIVVISSSFSWMSFHFKFK
jgi:hypothetical protein